MCVFLCVLPLFLFHITAQLGYLYSREAEEAAEDRRTDPKNPVVQDHALAVKWMTAAAEEGNHPMAMTNLGILYANGKASADGEEDHATAAVWYKKAVEQGYT